VRAHAQRYTDTVQLFLALGGSGPDADTSSEGGTDQSATR
jgi:hypothetical protein